MTRLFLAAVLGALTVFLTIAMAAPARASGPAAGTYALPSGTALFELRRWARHKEPLDHRTGPGPSYYDFVNEGPLGKAAHAPFPGSHALYSCQQLYKFYGLLAEDRFTSADPQCEGKGADNPHFIGYVSSTHVEGTAPLFRCFDDAGAMGNHFDTLATNCEGKRTIGILGFVIL
jgi:hypothetical protein